ncbi:MAG TPA: hypothetical protein VH637_02620 [Streptosporangiaceae bacterium]
MGYALLAVILFAVAFCAWGALYVRHELRPDLTRSRVLTRRVQAAGPGDRCRCGGTIARTLDSSGDLLGCSGCNRMWTLDGRIIGG